MLIAGGGGGRRAEGDDAVSAFLSPPLAVAAAVAVASSPTLPPAPPLLPCLSTISEWHRQTLDQKSSIWCPRTAAESPSSPGFRCCCWEGVAAAAADAAAAAAAAPGGSGGLRALPVADSLPPPGVLIVEDGEAPAKEGRGRAAPGVVAVERAGTPPSSLSSDDDDDERAEAAPPSETPPLLAPPSARSLRLRALTGAGLSVGTEEGGEGP